MSYSEDTAAAVDMALLALLSTKGRHASQRLVLDTGESTRLALDAGTKAARQWAFVARDHRNRITAFGHWVLSRWDRVCRDY